MHADLPLSHTFLTCSQHSFYYSSVCYSSVLGIPTSTHNNPSHMLMPAHCAGSFCPFSAVKFCPHCQVHHCSRHNPTEDCRFCNNELWTCHPDSSLDYECITCNKAIALCGCEKHPNPPKQTQDGTNATDAKIKIEPEEKTDECNIIHSSQSDPEE